MRSGPRTSCPLKTLESRRAVGKTSSVWCDSDLSRRYARRPDGALLESESCLSSRLASPIFLWAHQKKGAKTGFILAHAEGPL